MSYVHKFILGGLLAAFYCCGTVSLQAQEGRTVQREDRSVPSVDLAVHADVSEHPSAGAISATADRTSPTVSTSSKWAPERVGRRPATAGASGEGSSTVPTLGRNSTSGSLGTASDHPATRTTKHESANVAKQTQIAGPRTHTAGAGSTASDSLNGSNAALPSRFPVEAAHDGFASAVANPLDGFASPFGKPQKSFEDRYGFSEHSYSPEDIKQKPKSPKQPQAFDHEKKSNKTSASDTNSWGSTNPQK